MKQTAVEWYAEQAMLLEIKRATGSISITNMLNELSNILNQAKEMEKEQIIKAYNTSFLLRDKPYSTAEQYYKQTYESNTRI